jgi:hypothetical protein
MSKSSYILGLALAVGLHVLLFIPLVGPRSDRQADTPDSKRVELARKLPEPPPPPEPEPVPPPPPPPPPEPEPEPKVPEPEPPAEDLTRLHEPPEPEEPAEQPGDTIARRAEQIDEDTLPPLRIIWSSPQQLRTIAGQLGMRIVAVNSEGEVIGEIPSQGPLELTNFDGRLSRYSNRVRTLPRSFFGQNLQRDDGQVAAELWVLVPTGLDRRWIDLQKRAIATTGLPSRAVRAVEGQFAGRAGAYELVVTRILSAGS